MWYSASATVGYFAVRTRSISANNKFTNLWRGSAAGCRKYSQSFVTTCTLIANKSNLNNQIIKPYKRIFRKFSPSDLYICKCWSLMFTTSSSFVSQFYLYRSMALSAVKKMFSQFVFFKTRKLVHFFLYIGHVNMNVNTHHTPKTNTTQNPIFPFLFLCSYFVLIFFPSTMSECLYILFLSSINQTTAINMYIRYFPKKNYTILDWIFLFRQFYQWYCIDKKKHFNLLNKRKCNDFELQCCEHMC